MKIKKSELKFILNELADLLEFAEIQYRDGLVDGAHDPCKQVPRFMRSPDLVCYALKRSA